MADIKLTRPTAGQNVVVPSAPDARMVLEFAADQVSIDRPQGSDSLFFRFDDGSSIELQNFYTQYNKEAIPSFEVDGQLIAGADFFNAFDPDLAPAAGPGAGPTRAGGYTDYTNSDLADGLNSLGGLDLQINVGAAGDSALLATATAVDVAGAATVDNGVTLTPLTPPQTTPDTPNVPVQNGTDYPSTLPHDMMHVDESGMPKGSAPGSSASAAGGMIINAPDGVGSIVINGVTVWAGGILVNSEVDVPNGKLVVGYNATTGVLSYAYTLTQADQHNVANATGGADQVAHEILVSVTDNDGDLGQGVIRVEVGDDGPSLTAIGSVEGHANGVGVNYGADNGADAVSLHVFSGASSEGNPISWKTGDTTTTNLSTLAAGSSLTSADGNIIVTKNEDGSLAFKLATNGQSANVYVQATDADGDAAGQAFSLHAPTIGVDTDYQIPGTQISGGTVYESDLASGSNASGTREQASGSFTVNTRGEGGTVTIGNPDGEHVTLMLNTDGTLSSASANSFTTAAGSTVAITGVTVTNSTTTISYAYTLNTAQAHSSQGADSISENIAISVADGTGDVATGTLAVTVVDDVPETRSDFDRAVENTNTPVSGNVLANDEYGADGKSATDSFHWNETSTAAKYGTITLGTDGTYKYVLDNANPNVDALSVGELLTETFSYTITDADGDVITNTLTVTINGTNDAPTVAASTASIAEDNAKVEGNLPTPADVDAHDTVVYEAQTGTPGSYGTLNIDAAGHYTYTLNNGLAAVQALSVNDTLTESFSYTVNDGHGGTATNTLTVTINGTNDAPTVAASTASIAEDNAKVEGNLPTPADVDAHDTVVYEAQTGTPGSYGTLNIDAAGHYTYTLNNGLAAVQALSVNDTLTESFSYTVNDGHGGTATNTLTVTINGTNDAPTVAASTASIAEDNAKVEGNLPTPADVDAHDTVVYEAQTGTPGNYGTLNIDAAGHYTYTLNNGLAAVQALSVNDTLTESFSYTVNDGHGGTATNTLTVTINGTNDAPTVAASTASIAEDNAKVEGNLPTPADVDAHDTVVYEAQTGTAGSYGTLSIDAAGHYTYTLNNGLAAVQALSVNDTLTESFSYTVNDGHGGTATNTLTVTINGTNDAPTVAASTASIAEDNAKVEGNLPTPADVDAHDTVVYEAQTGTAGSYGTLSIDAAGHYTYTLNNGLAAVQALSVNDTLTESFSYTVNDGHGGTATNTLTVTINGTNDAPVATSDANTIYQGDPVAHGNVLTNDTDADGDHLTVVGVTAGTATPGTSGVGSVITGEFGTITINADGSYDYYLDNSNATVKGLNDSSLTDTFTYKMTDGNGGYSTATVKVTINDSKYTVDTTNGDTTINGGSGNDVLLGDQGGTSTEVVPGTTPTNYDVCIILDTSGSMDDSIGGTTRLALAQSALANLLNDLKDHPGTVNIKLIGFSGSITIDREALEGSSNYSQKFASLLSALSSAEADGGTNYEAAFAAAASWFSSKANDGYTKLAYFLSDGVPTARNVGNSVDYGNYYSGGTQMSQSEFTEAITEYNKLVTAGVQVNAIGIGTGIDANVLKYFDNTPNAGGSITTTTTTFSGSNYESTFTYTGKAGAVSIVNSAAELTAALNAGTPDELQVNLVSVGKDNVNGGAGNDILFGDAVNANWLLQDTSWTSAAKATLNPGDSVKIVREYVLATSLNGTTLTGAALEAAINEAISRELTEHSMLYGLSETSRGVADTLTGGAGHDMLFGQAGADILDGGAGHDMLMGGTGNDTLTGGTGADLFLFHSGSGADIITDYNAAQGDAIVRVGDAATGDSIKNSANESLDTVSNVHSVVDVHQGHNVTMTDSSNHLLVGSGVSTNGTHYTSADAPNVSFDNYLVGGGGDDVIYGGAGNNYLNGGAGNDHIVGGSGDSYLFGGTGNDSLYGGSGNDHLYGGAGNDNLDGGAGHDFLDGGTGTNTLLGGAGNDIMVHHTGDTISGGQGIDVMLTGDSASNLNTLLTSAPDVEVAIKGTSANPNAPLSLTDISKLANVGINISDTANGAVMTLAADKWTDTGDHHTFTNASANLTLTTSLTDSHDSGSSAEVAKFILNNS